MKKNRILVILLALSMMMLVMTACGGTDVSKEPAESESVTTEDATTEDTTTEDLATEENIDDTESEEADDSSAAISLEFKQTMDDYEAWFDHYCEVMQKYQDNPSDLSLLSEMTELLSEETAMLEQLENMDQAEMNTAELAYYLEVTARIEKKLLEVVGN